MSIQNKAMLVRLTVHAWTARKKDKAASKEIEQNHNAKDAGNYVKLLIDKAALQPYQQQEALIREHYYKMTLAWSDDGNRLLPSTAFLEFTDKMRLLVEEADRRADAFVQTYPQLIADARAKLGTLYRPEDYPAQSDIRRRFGIELDFNPVPDARDFRVDIGDEEAAKIRSSITKNVQARETAATRECWDRLYDAVAKVEEVLTRDKPRIFDTLMALPQELSQLLPKLNFGNDATLNKVCEEVGARLAHDADELRGNPPFCLEIARRAAELTRKIDAARNHNQAVP